MCLTSFAQEQVIDGVISAVSARESSVTVETGGKQSTYQVASDVKITSPLRIKSLAEIRIGSKVKAILDTQRRQIVALAVAAQASVEMAELSELPQAIRCSSPWISEDGLRLYFHLLQNKGGRPDIFVMTRGETSEVFSTPRKLLSGSDLSLTADELEIIFLNEGSLFAATRRSRDTNFSRPLAIKEIATAGDISRPRVSADGLTLFYDVHSGGENFEPHWSARSDRRATWTAPRKVLLPEPYVGKLRNLSLLPDGKSALSALVDTATEQDNIVLLSLNEPGEFLSARMLSIPGVTIFGTFPHYSAESKELYVVRANSPGKSPAVLTVVYRNVDLTE